MIRLILIAFLVELIVPHEFQEVLINSFTCNDGNETIFLNYRCDGFVNCEDGSDEENCVCPPSQFRGSNGYCVSSLIEFVALRDCLMYDDELVCGKNCTSDEFRCSSDRCIDKSKLCDGTPDCQFSIDEWVPECRSVKDQLERDKEIKCPPEKLPCYTDDPGLFYDDLDYHCVHMYEECFHAHQCRVDGCRFYLGCKEDEFTCYDAPCLNKSLLCDGKWNCIGGVDESPIACLFKIHESSQESTSGLSTSSVFVYIIVFVLIAAIVWQIYLMCWSSVSPKEKPVELNKIEKPPQAIEQKQSTTKVNKSKSNSTLDVSKSKPKLDIIKSKSSSKLNVVKSKSNPKLDETRSKSNSKLIVVKSKSSPSSN